MVPEVWPIQRGTTVVAKLFVDMIALRVCTNSSALVDVVAPPMTTRVACLVICHS